MTTMNMNKPISHSVVLGKIGSTYGVRGWLKLFSFTAESDNIFDYQPWFIKQGSQWYQLELEGWKHHNKELLIKLKDIDDSNLAHGFTNCEIMVDELQLPPLIKGDYYWKDLIGCSVVTTKSYHLGKVVDMMETGSNDVIVVKANLNDAFGAKERLIPYLNEQVVKQVDLATRMIEVDWDPSF